MAERTIAISPQPSVGVDVSIGAVVGPVAVEYSVSESSIYPPGYTGPWSVAYPGPALSGFSITVESLEAEP